MFTIPNLLTLLRALGIPVFLYLVATDRSGLAVATLMVAGATDYFDGKLARALKQESRLGELMDPAVDRLYIASVLIALYITDAVPAIVLVLIVARDLALGLLLALMKSRGLPPFTVTYLVKRQLLICFTLCRSCSLPIHQPDGSLKPALSLGGVLRDGALLCISGLD